MGNDYIPGWVFLNLIPVVAAQTTEHKGVGTFFKYVVGGALKGVLLGAVIGLTIGIIVVLAKKLGGTPAGKNGDTSNT